MKSENTLMHKAGRPSNCFSNSNTYYQAEQIEKEVACVNLFFG